MTCGTRAAYVLVPTFMGMQVIEARGLRKVYADTTAVDDVDLTVGPGEVVAVLGPNGAGKTTTIELLLGLRRPTGGTVRVFGQPPEHPAVRARVGAMLQDSDAPDSLTVRELVDLVGHYHPWSLPVDEVLERADLAGAARLRVGQLSGGRRQRLSFALAIVGDPDLLFLDEPTSALDVGARQAFWVQMRELVGYGKTVLFSTHQLHEADQHADRVVLVHRGRVVVDGPPAQVRATVGGSTVRLRTDAPAGWVEAMPEVRHVAVEAVAGPGSDGLARLVVRATTAEPVLARVFSGGYAVAGLTVAEASLEEAFLHLTGDDEPGDQPVAAAASRETGVSA
ncbi:MAG TPA: ABC transporter ATP-binding protein [Segeticoccus sp.]|uniref:ABC transporter ATP-binding protein n=1 Tax=Segeticoccus sp. TaxID=2706531 RepID=UPI002D805CC8|nr:ABC transporter ATP-binding protein [Segeticoccus sp.]HET8601842.1 ABC transporter ATP-binding protein [Segeticoccus sp.]